MRTKLSILGRIVGRALVGGALAVGASLVAGGVASADTPEYWQRETFHTNKAARATVDISDDVATPARRSSRSARSGKRRAYAGAEIGRLGGPDERPTRNRRKSRGVEVASLGGSYIPSERPAGSLSGGGGIRWIASAGCLASSLRSVIAEVAARFGSVTVNSTCRSRGHNARVGGAPRSLHLTGDAADFRVHGNVGAVAAFLRGRVGGMKHYGGGLFHIDTGGRRPF
jgi:hypothetical protein